MGVRAAVATLLTLYMTVAPFIGLALRGGEAAFFEDWSADQTFSSDCTVNLQKDPNRDFVILNLTDVQMTVGERYADMGDGVMAMIDKLIRDVQPDLITLTGDNAWSYLTYNDLIRRIDAYGIPWAPVMGNHDGGGCPSEFWCAYNLANAKHSLFRFGPADMGYGNYIIQICEGDKIVHTLFMMDTHDSIGEDGINGKAGGGYDHLWPNQLNWYRWAVNGTAALAGHTVESTVFFHIPVCEYNDAWNAATRDGKFTDEYASSSFGTKRESVCCPPENNGFFTLMQQLGSTKNVLCGHDHVNDYSIVYEGIRLTYSLKTGTACYADADMTGGTTVTVGADGTAAVQHIYIDQSTLTK